LVAAGARAQALVVVILRKGWRQVVGVIGVLRAGCAYVAVDPDWPAERIQYVVSHSGAALVLAERATRSIAVGCAAAQTVVIEDMPSDQQAPPCPAAPGDIAYVLYTSGSTGRPKGVAIEHRAAANTILDINDRYRVGPSDATLALSALSFDLSVYDIFGTLAAGGTIVMPEPEAARDPERWHQLIQSRGVTIWNSVPALMEMYAAHAKLAAGSRLLRLVLLSGDWIAVDLPERVRPFCAPNAGIVSLGGATEASIWSIVHDIESVDPDWPSIPYGKPLANQTFHVLNDRLEACPDWVTGHLYIGGAGLARCYWQDDEKTAASFIRHPVSGTRLYRTGDLGRYRPDGNIEFLGRDDAQVKIGGYRIELGEIESVLADQHSVASAVVVALGERTGPKRLVAYVAPRAPVDLADGAASARLREELDAALARCLPRYMIPSTVVLLERLPLNPNGKVDRAALPAPERVRSGSASGDGLVSEAANLLRSVVATVLRLESVDLNENFFNLGGDSVLGMQVTSRAAEAGLKFTPRQLFEATTLAELAAVVSLAADANADDRTALAPVPLAPSQEFWMDDASDDLHATWAVFRVSSSISPEILEQGLRHVVSHHSALRLGFSRGPLGWQQVIVPLGPEGIPLLKVDLRGATASRREAAIRKAAEELAGEIELRAISGGRAALIQISAADSRLLWVLPRVAMNARSWTLISHDLNVALAALVRAEDFAFPANDHSLRRWLASVQAETKRQPMPEPGSIETASPEARPVPRFRASGVAEVVRVLSAGDTKSLSEQVTAAFRCQLDEALLAAACSAAVEWSGDGRPLTVVVESALQDNTNASDLDTSRTVGPISLFTPLYLSSDDGAEVTRALRSVKVQLRSASRRGAADRADDAEALAAEALFTFSSDVIDPKSLDGEQRLVLTSTGSAGGLRAGFALDLRCGLRGERLEMCWTYDDNHHSAADMDRLSLALEQAVQELIDFAHSSEDPDYCPEDFPHARLDQDSLDAILQQLV
jgi:amino acid adenylation domain-containing protein